MNPRFTEQVKLNITVTMCTILRFRTDMIYLMWMYFFFPMSSILHHLYHIVFHMWHPHAILIWSYHPLHCIIFRIAIDMIKHIFLHAVNHFRSFFNPSQMNTGTCFQNHVWARHHGLPLIQQLPYTIIPLDHGKLYPGVPKYGHRLWHHSDQKIVCELDVRWWWPEFNTL